MTQETYGEVYGDGFPPSPSGSCVPAECHWDRASEVTQAARAEGARTGSHNWKVDSMVVTWVNAIVLSMHWARIRRSEPLWQDLTDTSTASSSGINTAAIDMARILKICCSTRRPRAGAGGTR